VVVARVQRDDFADGPVVDALHDFAFGRIVAVAESGKPERDFSGAWLPGLIRNTDPRYQLRQRSKASSAKTCLSASTAALMCMGRKCGGVASNTTSTFSAGNHLFVGIESSEAILRFDVDFLANRLIVFFSCFRLACRRSGKGVPPSKPT